MLSARSRLVVKEESSSLICLFHSFPSHLLHVHFNIAITQLLEFSYKFQNSLYQNNILLPDLGSIYIHIHKLSHGLIRHAYISTDGSIRQPGDTTGESIPRIAFPPSSRLTFISAFPLTSSVSIFRKGSLRNLHQIPRSFWQRLLSLFPCKNLLPMWCRYCTDSHKGC